jgi:hypothetical protein
VRAPVRRDLENAVSKDLAGREIAVAWLGLESSTANITSELM